VQTRISSPTDAAAAFMSAGSRDITLVTVPSGAMLCCQFVSIPSGFFVLGQRWHKNIGAVDPGFKMCWPFYYRVSHVVTRATITYSAPSRQVPCADNVMVDINLSLTFSIGPSFEDAEAFVYTLGCTRFDEFLAAEVEEGVRGLVYSVTHDRVNDLREEFAQSMLASLSGKFRPFGVQALAHGTLLTPFPHAHSVARRIPPPPPPHSPQFMPLLPLPLPPLP
jgi:regulator of protease activity HflC (stomatin/prohibitin superfamily)